MRSTHNKWLTVFATITAFCTLLLLAAGGLVTSHEAGMAVPDWPTSYGYNMFMFPFSMWVGGIFYEHSHRLIASAVGFLTIILMVWLWVKESRQWMRWLGVIALLAVVTQGVLGGLRVTLFKAQLGIFHATLAQLFFALVGSIALFTSQWFQNLRREASYVPRWLKNSSIFLTALILGQLALGATMRHQHAGLAIPDFPLAYGRIWPRTDPAFLAAVNARSQEPSEAAPVTPFRIYLHMAHRIVAVMIFIGAAAIAFAARRAQALPKALLRLTTGWFGLICLQVLLGIYTVLSNKAADIATAHVIVGALSLLTGTFVCLISRAQAQVRADEVLERSQASKSGGQLHSVSAVG